MRRGGWLIVSLLFAACPVASRGDYKFPIGDGYSITFFAVGSGVSKGGLLIFDPAGYSGMGLSIDRYATTRQHIFAECGNAFFIVVKADDSVIGPLSGSDFAKHPVVVASGPLKWKGNWSAGLYRVILLVLLVLSTVMTKALWACAIVGVAFIGVMFLLAYRRLRAAERAAEG